MSMQYIRDRYNVPAKRGMRVTVDGEAGVIVGTVNAHLRVKFGDAKHSTPCHPTWRVTYPSAAVVLNDPARYIKRADLVATNDAIYLDRDAPGQPDRMTFASLEADADGYVTAQHDPT